MRWMRHKWLGCFSAGLALAATVLHVAFVSLHVAAMASLILSDQAIAVSQNAGASLCGPARVIAWKQILSASDELVNDAAVDSGQPPQKSVTFCPICTVAAAPTLLLPDLLLVPAILPVFDEPATVKPAQTLIIQRFEIERKTSRGPPLSA